MTEIRTESPVRAAETAPALRYAFTIVAEVDPHIPLNERGTERLDFIPITGGGIHGEIEGEVVPGGGDWCTIRADGGDEVQARYAIRTAAGEFVDIVNTGVLRHLDGGTGGPEDMGYFLTTPVFRTAAPGLQWLTRSVFLGKARTQPTATTIDIYEVLAS